MNILVVEDVKEQREMLKNSIERSFIDYRVYSCGSVKEAYKIAKEKNIDLFFLDIELEDGSGIDLAKKLRKIEKYGLTGIIFITSNIVHIMEAFKDIHCYDFLVKPYNDKNVKDIIKLFGKKFNSEDKDGEYIIVNVAGSVTAKVFLEDIIFIEYANRSCNIKTKKGNITASGQGLGKILKSINSEEIIQCHKAFAINKKYIDKVSKLAPKIMEIHFWNCEDIVPLGYKYKDDIIGEMK